MQQVAGVQFGTLLRQGRLGASNLGLLGMRLQTSRVDLGLHTLGLAAQSLQAALGTTLTRLNLQQFFLTGLQLCRRKKALDGEALVAGYIGLGHAHPLLGSF